MFTALELRRVAIATAMMAVLGTVVIVASIVILGHYNSLAHAGPKAIVDGLAIALLMSRADARWRSLSLLGAVYGLVIFLQIGVAYLLPVLAFAGVVGAFAGRVASPLGRTVAVLAAVIAFELFASLGAPVKIYFATEGRSEPFLWGMWALELPLRAAGASIGAWLAIRWIRRRAARPAIALPVVRLVTLSDSTCSAACDRRCEVARRCCRTRGPLDAGVRVAASTLATVLPMALHGWTALGIVAGASIGYGLWAGLRREFVGAVVGLFASFVVFGLASYAWHREPALVVDLIRSLVLRFMPIAIAGIVVVKTVRGCDLVRLLRSARLPGAITFTFASVLRELHGTAHHVKSSLASLRNVPFRRRPIAAYREVIVPVARRFAERLTA
jgi:hypothetical protein